MSDAKSYGEPLAVKFSNVAGEFVAYASTFDGPPDSYGDVISRGAFSKSLAEHRAAGTLPALLWSHQISEPIGVLTKLYEDAKGLVVEGRLTLEVEKAREAHALLKVGALAMSIGFRAVRTKPDRLGRRLEEIKLMEVSFVSLPANTAARVISVKARPTLFDQHNPRVIEKVLRDAGVSLKHAKRIVSLGKLAFRERDVLEANTALAKRIAAATAAIEQSI